MPESVNPPVLCIDQLTVQPQVPVNVDGQPIRTRLQAVTVKQGQLATVRYVMKDATGDPVDLSACISSGGTLAVRLRESMNISGAYSSTQLEVTLVNPPGTDGLVQFTLTSDLVAGAGITRAEVAMLNSASEVIFTNEFFILVERGQWGPLQSAGGPLTLQEIRLHLRDSAPEDNLWLGIEEFSMGEIVACIERPVMYWNEARPPIRYRFNTATFPYRYWWLEGTVGCLYQMASLHYTRVHLPYQQHGGLMIDDKNKAKEYAEIGKMRWEEYKDWVMKIKVQINAMGAIQGVGSPYYGTLWGPSSGL